MIKCFNSVQFYLTCLTAEVNDGARHIYDSSGKLPYSDEES